MPVEETRRVWLKVKQVAAEHAGKTERGHRTGNDKNAPPSRLSCWQYFDGRWSIPLR